MNNNFFTLFLSSLLLLSGVAVAVAVPNPNQSPYTMSQIVLPSNRSIGIGFASVAYSGSNTGFAKGTWSTVADQRFFVFNIVYAGAKPGTNAKTVADKIVSKCGSINFLTAKSIQGCVGSLRLKTKLFGLETYKTVTVFISLSNQQAYDVSGLIDNLPNCNNWSNTQCVSPTLLSDLKQWIHVAPFAASPSANPFTDSFISPKLDKKKLACGKGNNCGIGFASVAYGTAGASPNISSNWTLVSSPKKISFVVNIVYGGDTPFNAQTLAKNIGSACGRIGIYKCMLTQVKQLELVAKFNTFTYGEGTLVTAFVKKANGGLGQLLVASLLSVVPSCSYATRNPNENLCVFSSVLSGAKAYIAGTNTTAIKS